MTWLLELKNIAVCAALVTIAVLMFIPIFSYGMRAMRKAGLFFFAIGSFLLFSAGTKPIGPRVAYDEYIANNGTTYMTNGLIKTGVAFKWRKTHSALPDSEPLYISVAVTNTEAWVLSATALVGDGMYNLALSNPETYEYYLWHNWVPPSPVHTNGVWLGSILEKAKGTTGVDKIIVINGQLMNNGKVISQ